jgi:hypothetical protein
MEKAEVTIPTIGFAPDSGVRIDLGAFLERRMLVQAASGGGKSTIMRAFAEQLAGKVQQFVIDTEGDLVTLREAGDFIIVGVGGDVPPALKEAKLLARQLMELGASAIFDLSGIDVTARRAYVKALFDELSHLPRTLWHPLVVWLDEGHVFAPQSESAISTEAVSTAAATWRKRMYCLVVATQRLSKLDKDVAAELHNKLIGFTDDVDVKRAGDQLGMTAEQRAQLQELSPLTFFAKGPAFPNGLHRELVRSPIPKTSPPPKGQVRTVAPPAPEKVRAILGKLANLTREAEQEARTVEDLRKVVAERDREIRTLKKGGVQTVVEKQVVDRAAIDRAVGAARAQWTKELANIVCRKVRTLRAKADSYVSGAADLAATVAEIEQVLAVPPSSEVREVSLRPVGPRPVATRSEIERAVATSVTRVSTPRADGITGVEQRILNVLGGLAALGVVEPDKATAAALVGYHARAKSFSNMKSRLRSLGLIDYPSPGYLVATSLLFPEGLN